MSKLYHVDKKGVIRNYYLTYYDYSSEEAYMSLPNFEKEVSAGIDHSNLLDLCFCFRGVLFSLDEKYEAKEFSLFEGMDTDCKKNIEKIVLAYWKKDDWQCEGTDAILFYYFGRPSMFGENFLHLPNDYSQIENWTLDPRKLTALLDDEHGGKFGLKLTRKEYTYLLDTEEITEYTEGIDGELWGYFYADKEATLMRKKLLRIIGEINKELGKWNPKYIIPIL